MPVVQKILVAFDDPASRTLEHAADLALALGSDLIVTNVAPADPERPRRGATATAASASTRRARTSRAAG